ncbi:MAG: aminotransferase class III-fold pyridoxal phosphate-dependent enzyme [candidate division KSB1 bacterium]|nr:aminotransferase class III-fold pyridoxal phosphate-dependent enzyme [candidate division KSB1 bacterium]MDZ7304457.1 aminotransferase class III-fold pyridoxal phosphate-dependent enzyme [candidate division KSB1 bacterium]MDZ7310950.1 aminotransferase class III-fold pyridoxal phosphate-dependent enzyme [candidate division KSB1 bacterium]
MKPSDQHFQKALALIPWGTQTNAKRPYPFFDETMPKFIERGKGCRIWDMEGKEYIDFRLALGPVTLGYCYDEVDAAVRAQMNKGVLFSMASPIELELAQLLHEVVPNAEMCRFMKTGEDANLCNVRIARAYTKRDMIIVSGYHGYPDWFATEDSPNNGVPEIIKEYVKIAPWGNLEAAEKLIRQYNEQLACVMAVPYDFNEDTSGEYIRLLRKLTKEYGIILILDEVLTGFRLALGGAQEYFGIDADLASYAKAMANGYPISTYLGKRQYMEQLNKFKLTTTYAGETLSIAAAIATIKIMRREKVHEHLWAMGRRLMNGFNELAKELSIEAHAAGLPPAPFLKFATPDEVYNARIEYLWFRELYREGIFANTRWFISYSHKQADIDEALSKSRVALKRALDVEPRERENVKPFFW